MPDVTALLIAHREEPQQLMEALMPLLYDELRHLARRRATPSLNTTALVHEAYLRLVDQTRLAVQDRAHFLALAARAMRFVVIDFARRRSAQKRGGGAIHETLDAGQIALETQAADLVALDEALHRLATLNERLSQVVECRFFGGLSVEETAEALGCSARTVKRDWQKARLWLHRELAG